MTAFLGRAPAYLVPDMADDAAGLITELGVGSVATLALSEAALMTGDRGHAAALKAAQFIVKAQDRESGGWRYLPGEFGDTSVFGWQIMALHSARQLGFESRRRRSGTPSATSPSPRRPQAARSPATSPARRRRRR